MFHPEALAVGRESLGEAPHDGGIRADDAEGMLEVLQLAAEEGRARSRSQRAAGRPGSHRILLEQGQELLDGRRRLVRSVPRSRLSLTPNLNSLTMLFSRSPPTHLSAIAKPLLNPLA